MLHREHHKLQHKPFKQFCNILHSLFSTWFNLIVNDAEQIYNDNIVFCYIIKNSATSFQLQRSGGTTHESILIRHVGRNGNGRDATTTRKLSDSHYAAIVNIVQCINIETEHKFQPKCIILKTPTFKCYQY